MGYFVTIDEMELSSILYELRQRKQRQSQDQCDYCSRPVGSEPSCKEYERHAGFIETRIPPHIARVL